MESNKILDLILDDEINDLSLALDQMADVNVVTSGYKRNLLHMATIPIRENATKDAIRVLANAGVNVNAKDSIGCTPLHYAARKNDPVGVEALLEYGADPNSLDDQGLTPLQHSVQNTPFRLGVVTLLIAGGADPNYGGENSAKVIVSQWRPENPNKESTLEALEVVPGENL